MISGRDVFPRPVASRAFDFTDKRIGERFRGVNNREMRERNCRDEAGRLRASRFPRIQQGDTCGTRTEPIDPTRRCVVSDVRHWKRLGIGTNRLLTSHIENECLPRIRGLSLLDGHVGDSTKRV